MNWKHSLVARLFVFAYLVGTSSSAQAQFTQNTSGVGLGGVANDAHTLAVGDLDGDDYQDLIIGDSNQFYRNNGDGTFSEATSGYGLNASLEHLQPMWGDFDNDGDLDFVARRVGTTAKVHLFENIPGTGAGGRAFSLNHVFSTNQEGAVSWVDYDLDGDIDLFVGYILGTAFEFHENQLRETGTASFVDVSVLAGVDGMSASSTVESIHWVDVDNDGDPDAYITTRTDTDRLLINQLTEMGVPKFVDTHGSSGLVDVTGSSMSVFGDFDNDGDFDFYQSHTTASNNLFRNELIESGSLSFTDVTSLYGLAGPGTGGALLGWVDYDNDGDLDLLSGNRQGANWALYENGLSGSSTVSFADVASVQLGVSPGAQSGLVFFDPDNDGDQDFVYTGNGGANHYYRNDNPASNWVAVHLIGNSSSRDGAGARVSVTAGGQTQIREVSRLRMGNSTYPWAR